MANAAIVSGGDVFQAKDNCCWKKFVSKKYFFGTIIYVEEIIFGEEIICVKQIIFVENSFMLKENFGWKLIYVEWFWLKNNSYSILLKNDLCLKKSKLLKMIFF